MLTKLARVGLTAAVMVLAATSFSLAETTATPVYEELRRLHRQRLHRSHARSVHLSRLHPRSTTSTRQNAYMPTAGRDREAKPIRDRRKTKPSTFTADYDFWRALASAVRISMRTRSTTARIRRRQVPRCRVPLRYESVPTGPQSRHTLPQFEMSTLYEAYVKYNGNGLYFQGGNLAYGTPWMPISDSRLKPVALSRRRSLL